jgi:hypothetical protein
MLQLRAKAARKAKLKAFQFMTGRTPGIPMHTGHVEELAGLPNSVLHPQKSFVRV